MSNSCIAGGRAHNEQMYYFTLFLFLLSLGIWFISAFAFWPALVIRVSPVFLCVPVGAATLCGLAAYRRGDRGLIAARYCIMGAFYSMLLVAPSVYLFFRLRDMQVPGGLVRLVYVLLYVVWLFGPITALLALFLLGYQASFVFEERLPFVGEGLANSSSSEGYLLGILGIFLVINVIAWWRSLHDLREEVASSHSRDEVLPSRHYILPFVYPIVLTVLLLLVMHILKLLGI